MINRRTHPDESDLMRYCDGELRARQTAQVARHLEACWECRTRVDDLKQTIGEYVRYQRDVLEAGLPPPPQPWQHLRARFAGIEVREPVWKRIFPRRALWLIATAAAAGTGILLYRAYEPRQKAPAAAVRPAAPVPTVNERPAEAPAKPTPRKAIPGPEDELRVIAALHGIGADLGDPIEVVRTSNQIVVTCSGLTTERLAEVRAALSGMYGIKLEVAPKPDMAPAGSRLDVVGAPHTPDNEQFVDGLLRTNEAVIARAHALRALAMRFPAPEESSLTIEAKAMLAGIRLGYERELARGVSDLARSLEPVVGPPPNVRSIEENWQARAIRLFSDAEQVDRLLGARFAGSQSAAKAQSPDELAAALGRLEADVRAESR